MANLKVNTVSGIGTEGTVFDGGLKFRSLNYLTLPKGTTAERFKSFAGSPAASARGIFAGSRAASPAIGKNSIDFVTISTTGNATDFGDLSTTVREFTACSSPTRGVFAGGFVPGSPGVTNVMQFLTIATTGDSKDFGDLLTATRGNGGASSSTRGLFAGGYAPSNVDPIEFINIQSMGTANDFGNLTDTFRYHDGMNSTTRAVFAGGGAPSNGATLYFSCSNLIMLNCFGVLARPGTLYCFIIYDSFTKLRAYFEEKPTPNEKRLCTRAML